ncbi:LuxR C-terminal-related transcriptional regulator [Streptomyces anulatus]|uniref:LuxR C-terminal-related transcriptional regulator n=1 Tax=Streptomyces anulatus TaxID=1892 RepID=UPI0022543932|nr:LuxR C-terminal-related transcriptional regulator [Streptomyces anulatus]MCX4606782.1 LuxR C-terminal-related transcriptional regulator [Streptomyces anulatus]
MTAPARTGPSPSGGGPVASPDWKPATGSPLTMHQLDVLRRIACGHSWKQIGKDLGITVGGVGSVGKQILLKLGAASSAQAVDIAHRRSLMTERPGCGDRPAYLRHLRRREPACWRCLAANAAHEAGRRAAAKAAKLHAA